MSSIYVVDSDLMSDGIMYNPSSPKSTWTSVHTQIRTVFKTVILRKPKHSGLEWIGWSERPIDWGSSWIVTWPGVNGGGHKSPMQCVEELHELADLSGAMPFISSKMWYDGPLDGGDLPDVFFSGLIGSVEEISLVIGIRAVEGNRSWKMKCPEVTSVPINIGISG